MVAPAFDDLAAGEVLDQLPAAVVAVDLDHLVTFWNDGATRLYGWTAAEALGRSVRELFLRDQPVADEVAAATHAGAVWEGEVLVRSRDGAELLVYVRNAPLRDARGVVVGVLGASMDVAELRRLEAERAATLAVLGRRTERTASRIVRLQRLTAALVAARTVDEVVETAIAVGLDAVGAAAGAVNLLSEDGTELYVAAAAGYGDEQLAAYARMPVDAALPVTDAIRSGLPVLVRDGAGMAAAYPAVPAFPGYEARAAIPVDSGNGVLGALTLSFTHPHDFADDDVELLVTIARQCGQAIERARLLAAEQAVSARNAFLAEAVGALSRSLNLERTLAALTELVVPQLADWVVVHVREEAGVVVRAVAHREPQADVLLRQLALDDQLDLDEEGGVAEVVRTGRSLLYRSVPEVVRRRLQLPEEHALSGAMLAETALSVPLLVAGEVVGTLSLARAQGPAYDVEDIDVLEQLAARAAVALSNARAYQRERATAVTLQESLLPEAPPDLPGLALAWRYLPGAEGAQVGGDWYDVFPLDHGRVGVVIGDVMGRGVTAAAVMGQLRAMARAYAEARLPPGEVLSRLDAALPRLGQGALTTLLYLVADPATSTVVAASAGHLPPLLLAPGRPPAYVHIEPGPPLGAGPGDCAETRLVLPAGSTLVLYTDGLVEDRDQPVDLGMAALAAALADAPAGAPEQVCEQALRGTGRDTGNADDTALLAVSFGCHRAGTVEPFVSAVLQTAGDATQARAAVRRQAELWQLPAALVDDVLLVLTELVSNGLVHAGPPVTAAVRLDVDRVRVEVHDGAASSRPLPSLTSLTETEGRLSDAELDAVIVSLSRSGTTGRGMTLVSRLCAGWGVEPVPDGKVVWAELLLDRTEPGLARPPAVSDGATAAWLRGLPVRLVLASATALDDMVRELVVARDDPAFARLEGEGRQLLHDASGVLDPLRLAARDALARGQRVVDVQLFVTPETVDGLRRLTEVVSGMGDLGAQDLVLAVRPDPEVTAFRTWWVGELAAQLEGRPATRCPFPELPA